MNYDHDLLGKVLVLPRPKITNFCYQFHLGENEKYSQSDPSILIAKHFSIDS
jgi:hypothetical protein